MGLFGPKKTQEQLDAERRAKELAEAKRKKEEADRLKKMAEERKIKEENEAIDKHNSSIAKNISAGDIDPKDYQAVMIEQNFLLHKLFKQLLINTGGAVGYLASDMMENMYKDKMVKFHKEYKIKKY